MFADCDPRWIKHMISLVMNWRGLPQQYIDTGFSTSSPSFSLPSSSLSVQVYRLHGTKDVVIRPQRQAVDQWPANTCVCK